MRRVWRVLLATLPLVTLTSTPAAHAVEPARDIVDACPPAQVPKGGFTDTGGWDGGFVAAIDCIVAYAIAQGTSEAEYAPGSPVSRGQMASFLMRTLDKTDGYTHPASPPDAFTDDGENVHHDNINAAAAEGIATGYPDDTFRPGLAVTRAQMASFVARALKRAGASLPASSPNVFPDDAGSAHEPSINALAAVNIVVGDGSGNYRPNQAVTRAQMALFLARSLDYLVAENRLTPPFDPRAPRDVAATALSGTSVRVTWLAPTEGTPESYNIYRITVPGGGDCPSTGYQKVGTVSASAGGGLSHEDATASAGTTYCYRVSAVAGSEESRLSLLTSKARVTTPGGIRMLSATVDTVAESVTITYSEAVTCVTGSAAQFAFGGATSTTPTATTCGSSTNVVLKFANATGGGDLTYRQSIDQPSIRVKNLQGAYAITPQTITVPYEGPDMVSAEADTSMNKVMVTYNEAVTCLANSKTQFSYSYTSTTGVPTTRTIGTIEGCVNNGVPTPTKVVTLTVAFPNNFAAGTLTYTQSSDASLRMKGEGGKDALSPDSAADQPPRILSAVADTVNDRVLVTYNQVLDSACGAVDQFSFSGAAPAVPDNGIGCDGATVTLSWITTAEDPDAVQGSGTLTYTQGEEANRIKDLAGKHAASQSVTSDVRPWMVNVTVDTPNQRLNVTYSEPVTCVPNSRTQFTYNGGFGAEAVMPDLAQCNGTTLTLQMSTLGAQPTSLQYLEHFDDPARRIKDLAGHDASSVNSFTFPPPEPAP